MITSLMTSGWPCNGTCNRGIYSTSYGHLKSYNLVVLVYIVEWINKATIHLLNKHTCII